MNRLKVLLLFFVIFVSVEGYAQSRNWYIDSLIHQISVESYRRHFDSLCTDSDCSRCVVAAKTQSADHDACRDYIFRSFQNYFGEGNAYLHKFDLENEKGLANVIGYKEGLSPWKGIIVVSAHYDSNNNLDPKFSSETSSPGANDNGTGIAAILEIARILSTFDTQRSVLFAAWDSEEFFTDGLPSGSNRWFAEKVVMRKSTDWKTIGCGGKIRINDICANINFDMFGNPLDSLHGKPLLWVCSGNSSHKSFVNRYVATIKKFVPEIEAVNYGKLIASDHYTFASRNISSVENLESDYDSDVFYHTEKDNVQNVNNIDYFFASNVARGGLAFLLDEADLYFPRVNLNAIQADEVSLTKNDGFYCLKTSLLESKVEVYDYSGMKIMVKKYDSDYYIYQKKMGYYFVYITDFYRHVASSYYLQK